MISIVVLSYNHEKYIAETLASVYALNMQKEVIIIDDCSKDSSVNVIKEVVAKFDTGEYTKILAKDKNAGLIDSLNTGLEIAQYDYIYFIASDDVIDVEGFTALYSELRDNKPAQFAMGNAWVYYTGEEPSDVVYKKQHKEFFSYTDCILREKMFTDYPKPLLLQATIFKKNALKNVGGWDKSLAWDDYPMFVNLFNNYSLINNDFIYRDNVSVARYRQHDTNVYKNLTRQLNMVEAAMMKLAPSELYNKAIARQYAFYFLLAGKSSDFNSIKYIIRNVFRKRIVFATIFYVGTEIVQWVLRKKK
ncbi:glycosyltransferase family A protein [Enterobacter asburiae]|uniref:glycosyltransferase family 2 protein n=1 Tax=Scandinavium sp. UTDF21-P1B TaxID=3446379 RepID=UPI0034966400